MSRPDDETPVDRGFLGRWAKRKQEVQRQDAAPQPKSGALQEYAPETPTEELPLPSLDSIVPGSNLTAFFQKHVPEALRTAALRKLWVTDPEIRNFIEMADYQWDFNNPDSIPGWSSSIEGVDVKAMLEKVMGIEKSAPSDAPATNPVQQNREQSLTELDADKQSVSAEASEEIHGKAESAIKTDTLASEPVVSDQSLIQNGAVQNFPEESIVYETLRKRGGSALPT